MSVRCKFKVDSINRIQSSKWVTDADGKNGKSVPVEMRSVKMSPVYGNNDPAHENTKFWSATPSGSLEFNTVNLEAAESLELGVEYYIDITPAAAK
jgi:hypothetical protein